MASNLNKAFMRAYAKDSGRPVSDPAAIAHENARPANSAQYQHHPAEAMQPSALPQPTAARVSASRPANPSHPSHALQTAGQRPIAASHLPNQPHAPTTIVSGRYVHASASQTGAPTPGDSAAAADAANVWQRIDAAHAVQPAHVSNPPSRPVTSSVGVGAASGPSRMYASAAAPIAPMTRAGEAGHRQPSELPLLPEEPQAQATDSQSVEARRRTVADFLYSAGKVPGAASGAARTARHPVATDNALHSAPIERSLERPVGSPPSVAAGRTPVSMFAGQTSVAGMSRGAVAASGQGSNSTVSAERAYAPVASSMQSPAYAPVRMPGTDIVPPGEGFSAPAPSIQPPLNRAGQIVRVDVPTQARYNDYDSHRGAVRPTSDHASLDDMLATAARGEHDERQRVDLAHDVSVAEQKLRRSKHKIFNPVWEVDSLQWPGVCNKLMEHRAESMAQVAAHLKAACQDGLSILAVTSPASGEGRTTVACCLARLAASHGLNVVLVDLDLDHPTLCLQTNLEVEHDWRDCIDGDIDLEEVAVHSIDDQLTILPLKDCCDHPETLASDHGVANILRELSESFELVIVDACRMNSSGNVITGLAEAQVFDAAIVVVDRRNSHQERIEDAVRTLQQTGVGSIGIVDNFSM